MNLLNRINKSSKFLDGFKEYSYALLRITTGYMFMLHGTQKLLDFPNAYPRGDVDMLMAVGGGIEMIGGALILLGLLTRLAAFVCSGTMAVAYWLFHAPGSNPVFPITNGGDLAVLYAFVFLFIACRGAGILSVDSSRS
jgi:putative oxidoreductase